jgi:hypothetical protein
MGMPRATGVCSIRERYLAENETEIHADGRR